MVANTAEEPVEVDNADIRLLHIERVEGIAEGECEIGESRGEERVDDGEREGQG
jgi:hypothetical protein